MLRILYIEIKRLFKSEFFSVFHLVSLGLWPVITLVSMFFGFFSFPLEKFSEYGIHGNKEVFLFLTLGYLCLLIFQAMVQAAWQMAWEKNMGTLEGIFMTPINRNLWLFCRVFSTVIANSFTFLCALILLFTVMIPLNILNIFKMLICMILILISAVIWGAFLTILFIALRNGALLFGIFEGLQECVSGVKIPFNLYPMMIKGVGLIFPLTHTIILVRGLFFSGITLENILWYLSVNVIMLIISYYLFKIVEGYLRKTGSFNFY